MKQTYYEQCGLMLIKDGRKSRLYKVENQPNALTMSLLPMDNIPESDEPIEVYPQSNLIITSRKIYTLDGTPIISCFGAEVSLYPADKSWIIVLDHKQRSDSRYCAMWWNGIQKYLFAFGSYLYVNDKYVALYIQRDSYWTVYNTSGALVLETECCECDNMEICGDFMIVHAVGNHTLYNLRNSYRYSVQSANIFGRQQLILCSAHDNFAICSDLRGNIRSYYNDVYSEFERADHIELFDFASMFCLKRGKKFYLYRFDGKPFKPGSNLSKVDFIAGNAEHKSLLIGIGENYRLLKFA